MNRLRPLVIAIGLLVLWHGFVWLTAAPPYMLPDPVRVASRLVTSAPQLAHHAGITAIEIGLGLVLGVVVGAGSALLMMALPPIQPWLLPVLIVGQTLPVFALAPLLTLWFGYGLASKVAMAVLIIYFPVTAALYDGLRRVEPGWLDLARTLDGRPLLVLLRLRLPAALPSFGSGLRVAAAIAPIGAVVGEWVGASQGLGYLMLYANARVQTDLMFAALVVLMAMALLLYFAIDAGLRALMPWSPDARPLRPATPSSGDVR
ncbi:ABC transporter permease [Marinivivus vitaminiproducens]|uniref:ABC transporter permease n=1 Tax=Marinivivus vitaminiproducens TaxID=3035935 RepID=UPI0027A6C996|nr:ABC transporter permease [Geminicoccaceae bacterium SCSIO 64248]